MELLRNRRWFGSRSSNEVSEDFKKFFKRTFGLKVRNGRWYRQALTHGSMVNGLKDSERTNERLEFLGDSILGAVIADVVFFQYPEDEEGPLTQKKAKLVSRKSLNQWGIHIGLSPHVRSTFAPNDLPQTVVGNALEALVGAMYLDHGYEKTKAAVRAAIQEFGAIHLLDDAQDSKSILQHWVQIENKSLDYRVEACTLSTGERGFRANLHIDGVAVAQGEGLSKKEAEQAAARQALERGEWRNVESD